MLIMRWWPYGLFVGTRWQAFSYGIRTTCNLGSGSGMTVGQTSKDYLAILSGDRIAEQRARSTQRRVEG